MSDCTEVDTDYTVYTIKVPKKSNQPILVCLDDKVIGTLTSCNIETNRDINYLTSLGCTHNSRQAVTSTIGPTYYTIQAVDRTKETTIVCEICANS